MPSSRVPATLPPSLDVVTVPDFDGARRLQFEARTLLFLACWREYAGAARSFPLHLACIGEPPPSVRWLAARCGATIHVYPPLLVGEFRGLNKLRGLAVEETADRRLLLDTDVLVLSDFSDAAYLGSGVAAAAAFKARVPDDYWPTIYRAIGVPPPTRRIVSTVGRLNAARSDRPGYETQNVESRAMLPYYNSGILVVPRGLELAARWEACTRTIAGLFGPGVTARRAVAASDQAGFAAALVALEAEGVPITDVPDRLHATWLHLYRRAVPVTDAAFLHAFGLFAKMHQTDRSVSFHIDHYCYQVSRRLLATWRRDPHGALRPGTFARYLAPALVDVARLRQKLRRAYRRHVAPALVAGR
jgi:hypothetical protein